MVVLQFQIILNIFHALHNFFRPCHSSEPIVNNEKWNLNTDNNRIEAKEIKLYKYYHRYLMP